MTPTISRPDQLILSHCLKEQALLSELLACIPRGTLYRHVEKLLTAGFLSKHGCTYATTDQGKRRLEELSSNVDWNIWDHIYPPMRWVPTPQHRAVSELTTSAVVARQADGPDDHHPGFLLMGPTLVWKTSEAKFECQLLGINPSQAIIDLTTESARSLLVRRDGKGTQTFKRELLDGPFIVFDDLLEADTSLRSTIHHFVSGRKTIPVDNAILRVAPVSLITLNPRAKDTLEGQTSFSTAQLRRFVITNFTNVVMPDLSNTGHQALEAAAKHGPLLLPSPKANAAAYRSHIVGLVRDILIRPVWGRVDTEMIITMVTGMTAFIPDPERAIRQTVYDFAITAETLGWTTPDWSHVVSRFSLHTPMSRLPREKRESASPTQDEDHIIIWSSAMDGYRDSALPPFAISDHNKARLLAIASQEHIPLEHMDHAFELILEWWTEQQRDGRTLDEVASVLRLAKELNQRTIAVKDVTVALRLRHDMQAGAYTGEELEAALDLGPVFRKHGITASDDRLEAILEVAMRLLNSDRSLVEIDEWLLSQPHPPAEEEGTRYHPPLNDEG